MSRHICTLAACARMVCALMVFGTSGAAADVWYASAGPEASDAHPGTRARPVRTIGSAVALAKPGDTVILSAGTYRCTGVMVPDGRPGYPITIRSAGDGPVILTGGGGRHMLQPGSHNIIDGLEFHMAPDAPRGSGIAVIRKSHIVIQNCRTRTCQVGISLNRAQFITIQNCEFAHSGRYGIHYYGSGGGRQGHLDPTDMCSHVTVRNCYMHDAGWNVEGTEGYGIAGNGAMEFLLIENCRIDNNSGDGILYEDWTVHSTARNNVIRGSGIAAIWIDNASMSVFENNYLAANNVGIWLSGEESSNRLLSDFLTIRNNIIVHNDWTAVEPSAYGRDIVKITSTTRDVYFDNNTFAFNHCERLVGVDSRPPLTDFRNIWFRNNIFWQNSGGIGIAEGLDADAFHFSNNLWSTPFPADARAVTGDPAFVNPDGHTPEAFRLRPGSAAIDRGRLLRENPLDFWRGARPHLPDTGVYDLGAHEYGAVGTAQIGLDLTTFPFAVPPYTIQFKAKPE